MPVSAPAFLPAAPLTTRSSPPRTRRAPPLCATTPPPRPSRRRPLPSVLAGAVAGALAVVLAPFIPPPPATAATAAATGPTVSKKLRYDGRKELDGGEKAMSLTLTAGTFVVLGIWAFKQNRRDDELESVRIKDEVERLDKLRAEFLDVEEDEESMDDEDLLASLKQRILDDAAEGDGDGDGDGDANDNDSDEERVEAAAAEDGDRPGDAAEPDAEEKANAEDSDQPADVAASDSLDMLKRMWEATDDDEQKKRSKS